MDITVILIYIVILNVNALYIILLLFIENIKCLHTNN